MRRVNCTFNRSFNVSYAAGAVAFGRNDAVTTTSDLVTEFAGFGDLKTIGVIQPKPRVL